MILSFETSITKTSIKINNLFEMFHNNLHMDTNYIYNLIKNALKVN